MTTSSFERLIAFGVVGKNGQVIANVEQNALVICA
jgi:hypothetical protein